MANEFREAAEAMIAREIEIGDHLIIDLVARAMELTAAEMRESAMIVETTDGQEVLHGSDFQVAARVKGRIESE